MRIMPEALSRRAFLTGCACAPALAAPAGGAAIAPNKPIALFNGKNLDGWYSWLRGSALEDPKKVFTVERGLLHISGDGFGVLSTRATYRDYRLVAEWKWGDRTWASRVDRARDSGILVHVTGEDGLYGGTWPESIEYQLIEGGCGDFILVPGANRPSMTFEARLGPDRQYYYTKGAPTVTRSGGRINWWGRDPAWQDRLGFRGKDDPDKAVGQWNRSEVICSGDSVVNIVNGVVVNHGTKSTHTAGRIAVQSEGAEIFFRRLQLLPPRPAGNRE